MVKLSLEDYADAVCETGPTGICIECGVEPDAEKLGCEACGHLAVEVARDLGLVEIEE